MYVPTETRAKEIHDLVEDMMHCYPLREGVQTAMRILQNMHRVIFLAEGDIEKFDKMEKLYFKMLKADDKTKNDLEIVARKKFAVKEFFWSFSRWHRWYPNFRSCDLEYAINLLDEKIEEFGCSI